MKITLNPKHAALNRCCFAFIILGFLYFLLPFQGCDASGETGAPADSGVNADDALAQFDERACTQLNLGTSRLLDASTEDSEAAEMALPDSPYTVRLTESSNGQYAGYVLYPASSSGVFLVYYQPEISVDLYQENQALDIISVSQVDTCSEVRLFRQEARFSEGDVILHFHNAATSEVGLVLKKEE